MNGTENNYKTYVGKEHNESLGLDIYEMDWRQYDPALGRFNVIDKMATSFSNQTPYHYGNNNPIFFKDPSGLFSTVVNEEGEVTDHKDDGDTNIYLNSRTGPVIGQEEEGVDYNVGDKIFNVDNSNTDYSLYSLIVNTASAVTSATAVGVYKIPKEILVYDESGKVIGKWLTDIKVPFKALKLVNGVLQAAGPVGDAISVGSNTLDVIDGNMSIGRFSFNTVGTGASLYATYAYGGPAGIAVGSLVYMGDLVINAAEEISEAKKNHPNPKIRNSKWYDVGTMLNEVKNIFRNAMPVW